ncbi:MAG: bifunctional (p)ppGpp synthetase/guanosine-3',5'-bis(diphosphate) 3'-pyrophosphohydrolase [Magnetococcales bacterium]|nr:bifunctional (p)ppGpp synthetase/guanosine-3',5'-bis(diphosphate) 3'-pyrophosphohydrolase [Magnetococcales bacterium]
MLQWPELIERIRDYHPEADAGVLERLRLFLAALPTRTAAVAHHAIPFHPMEVAEILTDLGLDMASVVAGMLVEGVTTAAVTLEQVRAEFGVTAAFLVEGTARIGQLSSRSRPDTQAEDYRRMILALARDIRVVLIRLALSLQQLRAMVTTNLPPDSPLVARITGEVLGIDAPIAHRLGIYWLKNQLEDLSFRLREPELYADLLDRLQKRRKGGADVVRKVVAIIGNRLEEYGIKGQVSGREKHPYSVWCKLQRKGSSLDDLHDLIAYRIVVENKADCYRALGMIHGELVPIPGRFKDYIALPKSNGYQSLHTACIGPFGNRIEIQIRTEEMHQMAEGGVAAHWYYKSGGLGVGKGVGVTGYAWLQELLKVHQGADDPEQFLENVKIDLFPDEIYLFTPQGKILTLPRGATPVDFAYAVHTAVGDRCQGCKVNGRIMPLRTPLNTGDTVEILTGKHPHPNRNWLQFVVSGKAKYCITRWIKERERDQLIAMGREMLERETRKIGHGLLLGDRAVQRGVEAFGLPDAEELFFQVGAARLSTTVALHRIFPEETAPGARAAGVGKGAGSEKKGSGKKGLTLTGLLTDMAVHAARCCGPVPGDPIVGIVTTGRGITIHTRDCPTLHTFVHEPERWIDTLTWPTAEEDQHAARLRVMVSSAKRALAQTTEAVAGVKANILEARFRDRDREPCELLLEVEVHDSEHLEQVRKAVAALPGVFSVERVRG